MEDKFSLVSLWINSVKRTYVFNRLQVDTRTFEQVPSLHTLEPLYCELSWDQDIGHG